MKLCLKLLYVFGWFFLSGCGGGSTSSSPESLAAESIATQSGSVTTSSIVSSIAPKIFYEIAGSVIGLVGTGLVLENSNGDTLEINGDGNFEFSEHLASSSNYEVRVKNRPSSPAQTCRVENDRGVITESDISN